VLDEGEPRARLAGSGKAWLGGDEKEGFVTVCGLPLHTLTDKH
jgi:hypothetical protein